MEFSANVNLLKDEGAYRVLAAAQALEKQGKQVVHLEIGQPSFKVSPIHVSRGTGSVDANKI